MTRTVALTETGVALERELTLLARHHLAASREADDLALDRSGYQLLTRLELAAMSLGALAEAFRLDVSTVNRQVAALRRKGLVERLADPDGGAAHLYRPTRTGRARLEHDRRIKQGHVARVVSDWDAADLATLTGLLERFNTSIEELEGRPCPRT